MRADIPEREYYGSLLDNIPDREYMAYKLGNLPIGNIAMTIKNAAEFGALIRQKRRKLGLTQDELATRCGVGLRFIIELEAGKPSCQLGKALTAAVEVGLHSKMCRPHARRERAFPLLLPKTIRYRKSRRTSRRPWLTSFSTISGSRAPISGRRCSTIRHGSNGPKLFLSRYRCRSVRTPSAMIA